MKRSAGLHPLSWDHHAALTSVVLTRKHLKAQADRTRLARIATEFIAFHRDALIPHFRHEEEWLIPRFLRYVPVDDDDVGRLAREHFSLHKLFRELEVVLRTGDDLVSPLTNLCDRLEAHVRFEERELFPRVEESLTTDELKELGEQLRADTQRAVVIPGGDGSPVNISAIPAPENG